MTEPQKQVDAWTLYWSMFNDGDEVYLITENDEVFWGKVYAHDTHCILKRPSRLSLQFNWAEVRFMSHDGFPVKKLMGADGSWLIERIDTTDTQAAIRTALTYTDLAHVIPRIKLPRAKVRTYLAPAHRRQSYCFGDPFFIEDCTSKLFNPGVTFAIDGHFEETLVLQHKGGAGGLLWDLKHIYYFVGEPQ